MLRQKATAVELLKSYYAIMTSIQIIAGVELRRRFDETIIDTEKIACIMAAEKLDLPGSFISVLRSDFAEKEAQDASN